MMRIYWNIVLLNIAATVTILLVCGVFNIKLDDSMSMVLGLVNGLFISVGYGIPALKKLKEKNEESKSQG